MSEMGKPRCKRRSVIEDELLVPLSVLDGALENIFVFPETKNALFEIGETHLRVNRFVQNNLPSWSNSAATPGSAVYAREIKTECRERVPALSSRAARPYFDPRAATR
jgi:hypothetical protein